MKTLIVCLLSSVCIFAQVRVSPEKEAALKADMAGHIESMKKQAQVSDGFRYGAGVIQVRYGTDKALKAEDECRH
jgi:hypothetical protein